MKLFLKTFFHRFWVVWGRVLGGVGRPWGQKKSTKIGPKSNFDKKLDFRSILGRSGEGLGRDLTRFLEESGEVFGHILVTWDACGCFGLRLACCATNFRCFFTVLLVSKPFFT